MSPASLHLGRGVVTAPLCACPPSRAPLPLHPPGSSSFDPSGDAPDDEVSENVRHLNFDFEDENWDLVSDAARDLVRRCLSFERDRITADGVMAHPWITAHCPFGSKSSRLHQRSVQAAAAAEQVPRPTRHPVEARAAAAAAAAAADAAAAEGCSRSRWRS